MTMHELTRLMREKLEAVIGLYVKGSLPNLDTFKEELRNSYNEWKGRAALDAEYVTTKEYERIVQMFETAKLDQMITTALETRKKAKVEIKEQPQAGVSTIVMNEFNRNRIHPGERSITLENPKETSTKSGRIIFGTDEGFFYKDRTEDALVVHTPSECYAVIDGMGGHEGGDQAALMLANSLLESFRSVDLSQENLTERYATWEFMVEDAAKYASERLATIKVKFNNQPAACFIAFTVQGSQVWVAQAGDVRLIVVDEKVAFATEDQGIGNQVGAFVTKQGFGELLPGDEMKLNNKLLYSRVDLKQGQRIVCASDGVFDNFGNMREAGYQELSNKELASRIAGLSLRQAMHKVHRMTKVRMMGKSRRRAKYLQFKPDNRAILVVQYGVVKTKSLRRTKTPIRVSRNEKTAKKLLPRLKDFIALEEKANDELEHSVRGRFGVAWRAISEGNEVVAVEMLVECVGLVKKRDLRGPVMETWHEVMEKKVLPHLEKYDPDMYKKLHRNGNARLKSMAYLLCLVYQLMQAREVVDLHFDEHGGELYRAWLALRNAFIALHSHEDFEKEWAKVKELEAMYLPAKVRVTKKGLGKLKKDLGLFMKALHKKFVNVPERVVPFSTAVDRMIKAIERIKL